MKKINREILQYSLIGAAICELISLALIGPDILFPYGLALGLAVSVIGLRLLAATIEAVTCSRGARGGTSGYIIRILLYALALCLGARTGVLAFAGCAIGLLIPKAALVFGQLAMPAIRKALGKEEPVTEHFVPVTDNTSRIFVKSQGMSTYRGGRSFFTYRHFKQYKLVQVSADESKRAGI